MPQLPMMFRVPLLWAGLALATGCRPGAPASSDGSGAAAPGSGSGASSAAEASAAAPLPDSFAALVAAAAGDGSGLVGMERPDIHAPSLQPCETADDCRVVQPSDWSPDVECCYEYGCTLDYVALSDAHVQALRAWQRANPFDCTAHLQATGPCENRAVQCGLSQEPPAAACVQGQCVVDYPDAWPIIEAAAQTCAVDAECEPLRTSAFSLQERCCQDQCGEQWAAVSHHTAAEVRSWQAMLTTDACAGITCGTRIECAPALPQVACASGLCAIVQ